jgi:hypothetical protein
LASEFLANSTVADKAADGLIIDSIGVARTGARAFLWYKFAAHWSILINKVVIIYHTQNIALS